jgi:phosphatidylglycerol---prolipoprotein diacylglyceryl transferase
MLYTLCMLHSWQHLPEYFNPIAFRIGSAEVSWYGIMYLVAFALVYYFVRYRIRTEKLGISLEVFQDFFPWAIIGLLLGARLGDVLIYDWGYFQNHLSQIFLPFDIQNHWKYIGIYGMSYFGGLIGITIAFYIFCRMRKINLLEFSDLFAPVIPLAFTFGRMGNFINGELYGRVTQKFWGMYFPLDLTGQLRHPSQLYEALLEGILLFVILWSIRKKNLPCTPNSAMNGFPVGYLTAFYLIGYGIARFISEFFREPDNGWFFWSLTFGQWLSIGIIILGILITTLRKSSQYTNS